MNKLVDYIIPFRGLEEGFHTFNYEINDNFFSNFEYSEIEKGKIQLEVILDKKNYLMHFKFKFSGYVEVQCDRCLGMYNQNIANSADLYVKFAEKSSDISDIDDIMYLSYSENTIDLSHHIYEYISLCLPIRKIHPPDKNGNNTCDEIMLEEIEKHAIEPAESSVNDPRWEKLKTLMN